MEILVVGAAGLVLAAQTGPTSLPVGVSVWAVLTAPVLLVGVRPCLCIRDETIVVRNVFVTHAVALSEIRRAWVPVRPTITVVKLAIERDDGTVIESFAIVKNCYQIWFGWKSAAERLAETIELGLHRDTASNAAVLDSTRDMQRDD